MHTVKPTLTAHDWTAAELRRLPPAKRDAILSSAAAAALSDYHNDPELTAFEAFGKEDLHGDGSDPRPR